ncbi:alpha/beta hydrolase [Herbiconiux sp. SYSU D00978]|uniref:alpha/beta hydrolase n=1 Tax=Herbiconiux sp. SYSU D00978 TaxID=2812562 RepID=UPI001A95F017|nr:alpha/beta hydrolase-fold protein [Herbiconiux sp. SYSU D00978]
MTHTTEHREGRLTARPAVPTRPPLEPGLHSIRGRSGDHLLLVPAESPDIPVPLVVFLHGSGGEPARSLAFLEAEAARLGFVLLVPKSSSYTWDVIVGGFGPDVAALDDVLAEVFDRFPVDPERVLLSGFSDGASYALTLGLRNGDLFRRILAFSPGFVVPGPREGRPPVFVSHGTSDPILPIDRCSREIVPRLRAEGYDVDYREFDDGHVVPPTVVAAALESLGETPAE